MRNRPLKYSKLYSHSQNMIEIKKHLFLENLQKFIFHSHIACSAKVFFQKILWYSSELQFWKHFTVFQLFSLDNTSRKMRISWALWYLLKKDTFDLSKPVPFQRPLTTSTRSKRAQTCIISPPRFFSGKHILGRGGNLGISGLWNRF